MSLWLISLICCVGMLCNDFAGTILTKAISKGRHWLAGWSDLGCEIFGRTILTAYGLEKLTTDHGAAGWLYVLPVLATSFATTVYATKAASRIK